MIYVGIIHIYIKFLSLFCCLSVYDIYPSDLFQLWQTIILCSRPIFVITFLGRQLRPSRPSRLFEIWRIVAFPRPGRQKRRKVCQGLDWLYSYSWVGTQSNWKLFLSQNNSGRNSPVHLPVQAWGAHGDHKVNSVKENIVGHLCWASLDNCLPPIIMLFYVASTWLWQGGRWDKMFEMSLSDRQGNGAQGLQGGVVVKLAELLVSVGRLS